MKIFLLGFMGSGKSYFGQRIAPAIKRELIDLDQQIEEQAGRSISAIFESGGEPLFRQLEKDCLRRTESMEDVVISTGGGAPCFFDNMEWMNQNGLTIYLQTDPKLLAHRLQMEKSHRPLIAHLNKEELLAFIQEKIAEREKYYLQARLVWYQDHKNEADWPDLVQKIQSFLSESTKN